MQARLGSPPYVSRQNRAKLSLGCRSPRAPSLLTFFSCYLVCGPRHYFISWVPSQVSAEAAAPHLNVVVSRQPPFHVLAAVVEVRSRVAVCRQSLALPEVCWITDPPDR